MMKVQKIIKYFALALAISLALNIVYSGMYIVYHLGNLIDGSVYNENKTLNNRVEIDAEVSSLKINLRYANLTIIKGEKFVIESNDENITWSNNRGNLTIKEKKYNRFEKKELKIQIPEHILFEKIDIETGTGICDIDLLNSKELSLELGAGKSDIQNLNIINNAKIESGVGEIKIRSSKLNNLDLEVGVGKFTLEAVLTGNNKVEVGVGSLDINLRDGIENYTVKTKKGIGSINVADTNLKNNESYGTGSTYIYVESGIGSINIR